MQKSLKRTFKRTGYVLLILYVMIGTSIAIFQEKLLFLPTQLEEDYQFQFNHQFEELFFTIEENVSINAIHFKAPYSKGVILYFHGNAGDLSRWGTIAEYFVEQNYDVLIPDYRTYGKSKGKLSEDGFYKDAQYCYDYLLSQYSETEITLYGRSLGTGIASYIAFKNKHKQLILETPYYNIADVAKHRFPILPVKKLLKYRFPINEYLPQVEGPITIFHGTDDRIVPFSSGKKLTDLGIKNLNFVTIQNGRHNNLIEFEIFQKTIDAILK